MLKNWDGKNTPLIQLFFECHWVLIGPSNIPLDLAICCKAKSNLSFCEIDLGQFQLLVGLVVFPSTPLKNMNVKKRLVEPQIIGVKLHHHNSTNQQLPLAPSLRTESQPGLPKQLPPVSRCTGDEVSDSQRFVSSLYLGEGAGK